VPNAPVWTNYYIFIFGTRLAPNYPPQNPGAPEVLQLACQGCQMSLFEPLLHAEGQQIPMATFRPTFQTTFRPPFDHLSTTFRPAKSTSGAKTRSKGAGFWLNFATFGGPVAFVKTVVSCTRNTRFGGLEVHLGKRFWVLY